MELNLKIEPHKLTLEEIAILLLLISKRDVEQEVIQQIQKNGLFKCVVTEIGCSFKESRRKLISSVIGASLDSKVIDKTSHHIHSLVHATEEAFSGILVSNPLVENIGFKLSIVRDSQWIAVALFGNCASHHMSNHKHIGIGVMHIA